MTKVTAKANTKHFDLNRHSRTVASFPELLAFWDKKRNRRLEPAEVTFRSQELVWWKCEAAPNHQWDEAPASRLQKREDGSYRTLGCPFCSNHRSTPDHSLASEFPKIARQWHPKLNGGLRSRDVSPKSAKLVSWRCPKKHVWQAKIGNRTVNGRGCPFCAGQALLPERSLAAKEPDLAAQWHPTMNGTLKPKDVGVRSTRKVWRKCPAASDHEWQSSPDGRVNSRGCPFCGSKRVSACNCLATNRPDLARQWHSTRNGDLSPRDVTPSSSRLAWWKCQEGPDHEWRCSINNRNRLGSGCPFCSGRSASKTNNLAACYPKVARQWHPQRNGKLKPSDITPKSGKMIWWQCPKGPDHESSCIVSNRTRLNSGCPFCAGMRVSKTNCLATVYPKVASQWHPRRNGKLKPSDVLATSAHAAWWRCALGHEWCAPVRARTSLGRGCPVCSESMRR